MFSYNSFSPSKRIDNRSDTWYNRTSLLTILELPYKNNTPSCSLFLTHALHAFVIRYLATQTRNNSSSFRPLDFVFPRFGCKFLISVRNVCSFSRCEHAIDSIDACWQNTYVGRLLVAIWMYYYDTRGSIVSLFNPRAWLYLVPDHLRLDFYGCNIRVSLSNAKLLNRQKETLQSTRLISPVVERNARL